MDGLFVLMLATFVKILTGLKVEVLVMTLIELLPGEANFGFEFLGIFLLSSLPLKADSKLWRLA
jgi:hypothetical protein